MADDRLVYIKRVQSHGKELEIASLLSSSPLSDDPRNHSVPLLDVVEDETDRDWSYIVMPFLRLVDEPPFETVQEVIDLIDQVLEVCILQFQTTPCTKTKLRDLRLCTRTASRIG